jgi:hypothetical protein
LYASKTARGTGPLLLLDICVPVAGGPNGCLASLEWSTTLRGWIGDIQGVVTKHDSLERIYAAERETDIIIFESARCYLPDLPPNAECHSTAVFSLLPMLRLYSWLNIVKTSFIILVLTFTTILFAFDAQRLVIGPIQRMTDLVRRLAVNPLAAINETNMDDSEGGLETMVLEKVRRRQTPLTDPDSSAETICVSQL